MLIYFSIVLILEGLKIYQDFYYILWIYSFRSNSRIFPFSVVGQIPTRLIF